MIMENNDLTFSVHRSEPNEYGAVHVMINVISSKVTSQEGGNSWHSTIIIRKKHDTLSTSSKGRRWRKDPSITAKLPGQQGKNSRQTQLNVCSCAVNCNVIS